MNPWFELWWGFALQALGGSSCVAEEKITGLQGDLQRSVAEPHKDNCTPAASLPGNSMNIS